MRLVLVLLLAACQANSEANPRRDARCVHVEYGYGKSSAVPLVAEVVASGLEVPWGLAFLPDRSLVVAERPGRLVRIAGGKMRELAHVRVSRRHEGGLYGIALDPDFATHRRLYVYYTADTPRGPRNRVERWIVAPDLASATPEKVIVDGIPSAPYRDGGRIAFGPDGKLYIATGDASRPKLAQDRQSIAGKILRLEPDGSIPHDNPTAGSPIFISGVRDVEAFAWRRDGKLAIADRGEITLAAGAANLGYPTIHGCDSRADMIAPALTWSEDLQPGGAVFYDAGSIAEWRGDLVVATTKSQHLHRIHFDGDRVVTHDTNLSNHGRLRAAAIGPDHELYVTTSNCDGHGDCPPERDVVLRVTRGP
jgi:glucose/arabinose dehydrogenase